MKITLTGSLGNINKPLVQELVKKGHAVTVISSDPKKKENIEAIGSKAAIGSIEDVDFLTNTFTGADVVYTMVPPGGYFDPSFNPLEHNRKLASNFAQAIRNSGVKRVVHLSSIGAHMEKDSGLILAHRSVEDTFNKQLPDIDITFMRPVGIYYNLLGFIPLIKNAGVIRSNYGADDLLVWVSPIDIAAAIADELETAPVNRKITYVASDEVTGHRTASVLGEAIGKPDLKWELVSDEQQLNTLRSFGLNPLVAKGLVEMFSAQHHGPLMEDYYRHKPALGKVKIEDFAKDFAAVYNQK